MTEWILQIDARILSFSGIHGLFQPENDLEGGWRVTVREAIQP